MASAQEQTKGKVSLVCPKCRSEVERITKTKIDKLINILVPIGRFKCYHCLWEGTKQLPNQD